MNAELERVIDVSEATVVTDESLAPLPPSVAVSQPARPAVAAVPATARNARLECIQRSWPATPKALSTLTGNLSPDSRYIFNVGSVIGGMVDEETWTEPTLSEPPELTAEVVALGRTRDVH